MFTFKRVSGVKLEPYVRELAELRIEVFRDFPYLYEGTLEYEAKYLARYLRTTESHITLAFAEGGLVGATTAIQADQEEDSFRRPLEQHGFAPEATCYFGESIVLSKYRGWGLGRIFMEDRLKFARQHPRNRWAAFCAVQRPASHPKRPANYRPLDDFWRKVGFSPHPEIVAKYSWQDVGESQESEKTLMFWIKPLDRDNSPNSEEIS